MSDKRVETCPFNEAHIVPKEFFKDHLIRCRRHFKTKRLKCPYRPWEMFYPQKMLEHMMVCPAAPRSRTREEHKAVFNKCHPRDEYYYENDSESDSSCSENGMYEHGRPILCPFNEQELIRRDMIKEHILRCDFADDYEQENSSLSDLEGDSA